MSFPELAIIDIFDAFPDFRFTAAQIPAGAEMAIIEPVHLRSEPGGNVDAVRNVSDGNSIFLLPGKKAGPHGARNLAMQRRNSVGAARKLETKHGHAEALITVGVLATESHKSLFRKSERLA